MKPLKPLLLSAIFLVLTSCASSNSTAPCVTWKLHKPAISDMDTQGTIDAVTDTVVAMDAVCR